MGQLLRTVALLLLVTSQLGAAGPDLRPVAQTADPEVRRLELLIVVYTRSFSHALSREQLERLHEEVLEFIDFYQTAAGDAVDFRISLLQIDREQARAEVSEVAPGRYYLAREDIESELLALGMLDYAFDEVIALYAWNNANSDGAVLAYGGGAVGPDGKFLGDAGYNSVGVFAWDPGRISQVMIHEVLHNLDDMFSMSGLPDGFLNSDEMSRNMATLLKERPGAFLPHYNDDEMTNYAERELANRATYPWSMQLVYYRWMLERTRREAWLGLRYGRRAANSARARGARPLYDRIFLSRANHEVYFPVIAGDATRPPAVQIADARIALRRRNYQHTDFDGRVLFEGPYYSYWLGMPRDGKPLTVKVGQHESQIVPLAMGDVRAPARAVIYEMSPDVEVVLPVEVRAARFAEPGPPVDDAKLLVDADGNLPVRARDRGHFLVDLSGVKPGKQRLKLTADGGGLVFVPRVVEVERRSAWRIRADSQMVVNNGAPVDITVRVAQDTGAQGARVTARLGDREVRLRELEDGRYSVVVPEGLPPGLHSVLVTAEIVTTQGTERLEQEIPVYVEARGWIEVPPRIQARASGVVRLEARVRDRMGQVVRAAALPIAVVVGPELISMEEVARSGRYVAEFTLPAGDHRVYVIGLEGSYERRVVLVEVR